MSDTHVLLTLPFPSDLVERLRAVSPALKFHLLPVRQVDELPEDLIPQVEILYTNDVLPLAEEATSLRWIQFHYAGIDHVLDRLRMYPQVAMTTLSGAAVSQMAESALMHMLALGRRLPRMMLDKAQKHWAEDRYKLYQPLDLRGATVGIMGYGSIGREIARLSAVFGARVLASKRDLRNLADRGYIAEGKGDPRAELVDRLYPPQAVRSMVRECDFVVACLPLTVETRGLIGEQVFHAMKPSAFLVDLSRGGVVDHGALVSALNDKRLAGAALDVFPVEPLPKGSPLWEMHNVIISPHVAGFSSRYSEQAVELFSANLKRYLEGQELLNLVDPELGY